MSQGLHKTLSDEDLVQMAIELETREFTAEELAAIAATRRSTPRRQEVDPSSDPPEFG